jgi:hypothetical protein
MRTVPGVVPSTNVAVETWMVVLALIYRHPPVVGFDQAAGLSQRLLELSPMLSLEKF